MTCEIIAVGTELLMGQITNTNARFIAARLPALGFDSYFQTVVGDNPARLKQALSIAVERSDAIILTGGLGPTDDDLTKEVVADFCGLRLILHQESLDAIEERFKAQNYCMTKNNQKQALIPENAVILKNPLGTAPGALIEQGDKTFAILPGPPFEMRSMFVNELLPLLLKKSDSVIASKTLRIFGIGESRVAEMLKEEMRTCVNPSIAPYAKTGETTLRITAKAKTLAEAEEMLIPLEAVIRQKLGEAVYGEGEENSIQNTVVELLKIKNLKLATAESCTGGLIASMITALPGVSEVFDCGVVTYGNYQKEKLLGVSRADLESYGAVSEQTALAMCKGVKALAGADIGISVTGVAGPNGGTAEKPVGLVWVGICAQNLHTAYKLNLAGDRNTVQTRAAMHVFDIIRKFLLTT